MKLEDRVSNLELSKRLKELGVKQESTFSWFSFIGGRTFVDLSSRRWEEGHTPDCAAFDVAELLGMLKEMGKKSVIIPLQPLDKNPADYLARYVISEKTKV